MTDVENELEQWARKNLPVYEFMDLKVDSVSNGVYRCSVPLTQNTGNHINTVHAALQWASAEMLGGLVVLANRPDEKFVPVLRSLDIEFKRPARSDITAEARFTDDEVDAMVSALRTAGRYDFELCALIRDIDGEIVAEARACYAIRTIPPSDEKLEVPLVAGSRIRENTPKLLDGDNSYKLEPQSISYTK